MICIDPQPERLCAWVYLSDIYKESIFLYQDLIELCPSEIQRPSITQTAYLALIRNPDCLFSIVQNPDCLFSIDQNPELVVNQIVSNLLNPRIAYSCSEFLFQLHPRIAYSCSEFLFCYTSDLHTLHRILFSIPHYLSPNPLPFSLGILVSSLVINKIVILEVFPSLRIVRISHTLFLSFFLSVTLSAPALDRKAALISAPLASTYIILTSVSCLFPFQALSLPRVVPQCYKQCVVFSISNETHKNF